MMVWALMYGRKNDARLKVMSVHSTRKVALSWARGKAKEWGQEVSYDKQGVVILSDGRYFDVVAHEVNREPYDRN